MTLRYRYTVCRSVSKSNTIPVPTVPVLETPRVCPYPWQTRHGRVRAISLQRHEWPCTIPMIRDIQIMLNYFMPVDIYMHLLFSNGSRLCYALGLTDLL